ncbi:unnamed protein product [Darwinula stevensoni]|uniref:Uncharacterized protein n=1 Tax=Darwinula stevensoni TaxID=69355 RepID=A0A7R9FT76_9CRUS|nr:unnamed protein product [Darwinula stevensoni]CAG0905302.1 unnamed protein product [Darwinula stevensoni]
METSPSACQVSSDADFEAWKKFHGRKKMGFLVAICIWILGLMGFFICFLLMRSPIAFVFMVVALGGIMAMIKVPFPSFDKGYREPRCRAAGVDPHLYMFPNVPYLFVENVMTVILNSTWYVLMPEEVTLHANLATKIKCRVHRDAVDAVRGKSWHLKSTFPSPEEGLPPFALKHFDSGIQSRTDMVEVFLTDSPIAFSRDLNRARSRSLPASPGTSRRSPPASQFQPAFSKKSDLPPSYEDATEKSRSTTGE